jgi:hypothetical protein
MKTALRLISVFAVISSLLMISCSKENDDPQAGQKSYFIPHNAKRLFSGNSNSMLHQISTIAKKLDFAETQQLPEFVPQAPSSYFTGGQGTTIPVVPIIQGGCKVSSFGLPNEIGFVFNYDGAGRIKNINCYEYGYEISIFFTYNTQGQIIKTEYFEVYDGNPELYSYDVFTYNSQGQVIQFYENIVGYMEAYFDVTYEGQTVKFTTDFYDSELIYQYSNGNVVKETMNVTVYGDIYTETTTYQYDNKNNFWKPLNIPQPFLTIYAWMESANNMTKQLYTDIEGYSSTATYQYDYNSAGYPTYMYSDYDWMGPINYLNCEK